tara:strand:+ start:13660 stop:16326 length:2667 start_codon:yes stop_codon:yes gene_type:complete
MGENLVAGILKNIETLANVNANQNVAILTGIKKTNTLLSDQIGKELSKQTKLLESMVSILLKGLKGKPKKEESPKKFGGGALAAFAGMAKLLKKRAPKHISILSGAIRGLAESMKLLIETINSMDTEKFDAFIKIFDIGKKILLFAVFIALAGPLLAIGLIITIPLLFLIFLFFDLVSRNDKGIRSGIKTLMFMAISIGILALVIAFTLAYMGGGMEMLKAFGIVTLSIVVLAFGLFLVGKIKGDIVMGALAMLVASIAVLVLSFAVSIFAMSDIDIEDVGLLGLTIVGLAIAMAIAGAGPIPGFIALGGAAMIVAGVSVLIIAAAMAVWSKADVKLEDVGVLGATILMIGVEYAAAGLGALFIGAGAAVMLPVSISVSLIASALKDFSDAEWSSDKNDLFGDTIENLITSFKKVFKDLSFKEMRKIQRGARLLGKIGNSLTNLAEGLGDFAAGKAPIYEGTEIVGYKMFDSNLGEQVSLTIKSLVMPLIDKDAILARLGAGADRWWRGDPVAKGIELLGQLGNSLGSFAAGIGAFAKLKIVKMEQDPVTGEITTKDTGEKINPQQIGLSIKALVTPLVGEDSVLAELGKGASYWRQSNIGKGVDLLGELGNALADFASGVQAWADFKIPIFGEAGTKNATKVVRYEKLNPTFAQDIGDNLKIMIEALTVPITNLGKQGGDWWRSSDYEDGIKMLGGLGGPLESLAKAAETFGKANFSKEKIDANLSATIGTLISHIGDKQMDDVSSNSIDRAEDVIELFTTYATSVSKLNTIKNPKDFSKLFIDIKESVNGLEFGRLNKLVSLTHNMANFAEAIDRGGGRFLQAIEKLVIAIGEGGQSSVDSNVAPTVASEGGTPVDLTPLLEELEEITTVLRGGIDVTATNDSLFK